MVDGTDSGTGLSTGGTGLSTEGTGLGTSCTGWGTEAHTGECTESSPMVV